MGERQKEIVKKNALKGKYVMKREKGSWLGKERRKKRVMIGKSFYGRGETAECEASRGGGREGIKKKGRRRRREIRRRKRKIRGEEEGGNGDRDRLEEGRREEAQEAMQWVE